MIILGLIAVPRLLELRRKKLASEAAPVSTAAQVTSGSE